jgi:hypothetical protein
MVWWITAVLIAFATGIVTLAAAGADPPVRIQTFSHSSKAEREFDRRASRLLAVGFTSVGMAMLISLVAVVATLTTHH